MDGRDEVGGLWVLSKRWAGDLEVEVRRFGGE